MPRRVSEDSVALTIGAIYDAAVSPGLWMDVLDRLRSMFGLSFAASVVRSSDRTKVDGIAAGVDRDDYQAFLTRFYRTSIFLQDDKAWFPGQIVRTEELVPHRVFCRTAMYQEYWRPRDMLEGLRMAVSRDAGGVHHSVNLVRPPSGEPFDAADTALARVLMPHLQRASELARRLRQSELLASAALATLDVLGQAVLLLDETGRVLHANAKAEALLLVADGLASRDGMLQAATPALTARLQASLAAVAGANCALARAASLRLPRPGGGAPLALIAAPFRREVHWSLSRRPTALVCVTDPDAAITVPGLLMLELFGLTGAEAALATNLMAGKDLRDIARERGRSINTVRTQLTSLMAKTGTNRQSDLVKLMAILPRVQEAG
jgi:DNA-binding CsgD family transcriptional regulator/PAS domain-containing protein